MKSLYFYISSAIILLFTFGFISVHTTVNLDNACGIRIGKQIWSCKNLEVKQYSNGDTIPEAESYYALDSFDKLKQGAWCKFQSTRDTTNYGLLYNWYAVRDSRGLAPKGWHVASNAEWKILIDTLGGWNKAGHSIKSVKGWMKAFLKEDNGDNSTGFNALPGGYRDHSGGGYSFQAESAYWWSNDTSVYSQASVVIAYSWSSRVEYSMKSKSLIPIANALSVRCIKD